MARILEPTKDSSDSAPRVHFQGMGAVPLEQGVGFRVWAPHAEQLSVIGTFNNWNVDAHPMFRDEHGCWSGVVETASIGDEYKYSLSYQGKTFTRIDPRARQVTNSVGNGIIHDPHFDWQQDQFQLPPWNELVIYEMHVGTFFRNNSDEVGTFEDVCQKFDHLRKLGINVLQVMPVAEFAGDLSWGYNPAHPFAIESAYGGPQGFKTFVRAAHQNGLAVILDVVYNHFGPSDLDLWQFDGWSENGKGGIYFFNDERSSTPWGDTRPDYGRGEVRSYIRDNAIMWLEDYHIDGLRYDMTLFIRSVDAAGRQEIPEGWGLTQWVNREVRHLKPTALTIAEDLQNNAYLTKAESEGGAGFSSQWDAKFVHPVRAVLTAADDAHRDMHWIRDALQHNYNGDCFQRVVYSESHDEVANGKSRIPSEVDAANPDSWFAQKRSALGLVLTLTAPGIPMLFQGQELLQEGWFQDTEELDWENAEHMSGIVALTSDLIALRLNRKNCSRGLCGPGLDPFHFNNHDKVIAYRRYTDGGPGDDVIVILNFANKQLENYQIGLPASGNWRRRFSSDRVRYSEDFSGAASGDVQALNEPYDGQPHSVRLRIPPYTALIYSQDRVDHAHGD
jgi:1,4-alpha-glucan branching enzyme